MTAPVPEPNVLLERKRMIVLGVTGHRPPDLGGYSEEAFKLLTSLARKHIERIGPSEVITGMALGWDQACAVA